MRIDTAGSDNHAFPGDRLGSRSDNYVHVRLHVGIASLTYGGNTPVLDADVGLHNPPVIENERVGDYGIDHAFASGTLRLTHAVADDFAPSELHFLAVGGEVLLPLDDEVGIRETDLVADGGTEHLC